jgi:hypothetical protein
MSIKHRIKRLEQKLDAGRTGALLLIDPTEEGIKEVIRKENPRALLIFQDYNTDDTTDGADED